ncbi:AraC family transcriptional regulator [Salinimicrobium marinum]|uniref:AraC family transcriptional regulator n=1 Tax=Salinimicrobium marinum TaxID=680283 RepID=A0A918SDD5_9FLAO|nr:AraC family transcriptional regulator [Salinimicrobium marinum]GHA33278.1 AraC family transcriptional regulator [Salinimicrobium marinum]
MKIITKALPVEDILLDLSKQFKASIEEDGGEFMFSIPEKYGEGYIRGSSFQTGIGIIEYHCTFYTDLKLVFTKNKTHPLKFIFCSKGKIDHSFENDEERHTIDTYQNIIVSSSGQLGHVLFFKANETVHVSSLEIVRKDFSKRSNYKFEGLDEKLKQLFKDSDAQERFFYQGNYSIKAADIVEDINKKEFSGFMRSVFLEGKLLQMLVLQISQYHDDTQQENLPQILRRSDVEKVKKSVDLIKSDLSKNHSVEYLAKQAGTNVNKLQDGFKHTYGLTVNKYMQQEKLEAAKEMLITSDYNISQIVQHIGLNNRSYFSKIFKEKYGVNPKHFLNNRITKTEEKI